ncbi:MAG TPA: ATP-binding protein, partial [Burkholderiales bacterium]|nr:ATP-binding protein [Burkholderiales bacterium]
MRIMTVALRTEQDVVTARQRARQIAELLGFDAQDQARIATSVSEIARNALRYAGQGQVEFEIEGMRLPQVLTIQVQDKGRGIPDVQAVLSGQYRSSTGMGFGIIGARRLMDHFTVASSGMGTTVVLKKIFPPAARLVDAAALAELAKALTAGSGFSPLDEVQQQNRELMRTLGELRERQEELLALNRELEDTNRGVVALYAELEERADSLRRADETKTRFLSNMSHEFRTPLNSIRALTALLLSRTDGPLTDEQATQLQFVRKAADDLTELIDDLLDLAKIEAGKTEVRPVEFSAANLFSALRGMLRPLLVTDKVALRFENADEIPTIYGDEAKISQILRNFISNALKFTERGEIRVAAEASPDGDSLTFSVADTGIGISQEDQEKIFEEFVQVHGPMQSRTKGTGLGLPLCRKLSGLLGGKVSVASVLGQGSTFSLTVPVHYALAQHDIPLPDEETLEDPRRIPVLVVEDEPDTFAYYEKIARGTPYLLVSARTLRHATELVTRVRPAAVMLDIVLGGETTWGWLGELKSTAEHAALPVIVASNVDDPQKGFALGADAYLRKPIGRTAFIETLNRLTRPRILVIDDDPAARYTVRKMCEHLPYHLLEAADAREGLRVATTMQPRVIVLDLNLPDRRGEEVLRELSSSPTTTDIPVVVLTSEDMSQSSRDELMRDADEVLS